MFKATIIFTLAIDFLLFLVFADYLNAVRVTDRQTYLIIIFSTLVVTAIFIYSLLMHARVSNLEQQVKRHVSDKIEW